MRVLLINSVCGAGSTGKICVHLAQRLTDEGHEVKIAYGRGTAPESCRAMSIRIGGDLNIRLHGLATRLGDAHGFASKAATRRFLRWAEEFRPELLWLHNIHGYYINIEMLFAWIKKHPEMQVKWTLHDCWAFTGHCAYFTMVGCERWKTHCEHCVKAKEYPASLLLDRSRGNFDRKRTCFTGVKNMTLVTPSQWLADLVKQSFLRDYPVQVVYNAIDTQIFRPTPSRFRAENGLEDKIVILGVANIWDERKGLKDFLRLADGLDERFRIVLVGLSESQRQGLPKNVLGLGRTASAEELAQIYTAADVFFNPTYEDNFPTVNLEAEACGTTVVSYDTGGCRETLKRTDSFVIPQGELAPFVEYLQSLKKQ